MILTLTSGIQLNWDLANDVIIDLMTVVGKKPLPN